MYIPKHFLQEDQNAIMDFMRKYSFATVISVVDDKPVATHLPVIVSVENDEIVLWSHFAKANPQGESIRGQSILTIFSEPHAYISPRFYEKEQTVPTWNYIAIHAYGIAELIESDLGKLDLMEKTVNTYEQEYLKQWDGFPMDFKLKMLNGITAFKINITQIDAKHKLSQNKSIIERQNIIKVFNESDDTNENVIASYMKETI